MKTFSAELLRLIRMPVFYITAVMTLLLLLFGIERGAFDLFQGYYSESRFILEQAFLSKANMISLPLLSALPSAASCQKEISQGVLRSVLFRTRKRTYLLSRCLTVSSAALLAQMLGILLFWALTAILTRDLYLPLGLILSRLCLTAIFSMVGAIGALLAQDSACAYVAPVTLCFSLSMLKSRFFTETDLMDPLYLMSAGKQAFPVLALSLIAAFTMFYLLLKKEVSEHV